MGASDPTRPDYQLGPGCLADQLVGQLAAHVCGLGPLGAPEHTRQALGAVFQHNSRSSLAAHMNGMRALALNGEGALLLATYPGTRPTNPFPYYPEAWTGLEYTAAAGMIYEGLEEEGRECVRRVRERYDGLRRNPFDEAECGHHYARAMAAWAAVLAWTGFRYSAVTRTLTLAPRTGRFFWSSGWAWGDYALADEGAGSLALTLRVVHGRLDLGRLVVTGFAPWENPSIEPLIPGASLHATVRHGPRSSLERGSP